MEHFDFKNQLSSVAHENLINLKKKPHILTRKITLQVSTPLIPPAHKKLS